MKKIIIASRNPIKVNATILAFKKTFPDKVFQFEGAHISSDISDQPMSNNETLTGAMNRSNNAKLEFKDADYWIGIEGGVEKKGKEMQVFAWIFIQSKDMKGKARTATFDLPKKIIELIDSGMELGDADDIVFHRKNSKQKNGAVGILTKDLIDREKYYTHAIIMALIPFNNMELY